jgi:hypothetical protein
MKPCKYNSRNYWYETSHSIPLYGQFLPLAQFNFLSERRRPRDSGPILDGAKKGSGVSLPTPVGTQAFKMKMK